MFQFSLNLNLEADVWVGLHAYLPFPGFLHQPPALLQFSVPSSEHKLCHLLPGATGVGAACPQRPDGPPA